MTAQVSTIYLLDAATGDGVAAELHDVIGTAQVADWEAQWRPAMLEIVSELTRRGVPKTQWPQSWHWDWERKTARVEGLLAFPGFAVVCDGVTQGLMQLNLNRVARLPNQQGKPLVYVEYLEVAPWNQLGVGTRPRYKGVGSALMTAAVALSVEEEFKGRIGLHALPQADTFYHDHCGMTDLGPDFDYQHLRYFEMSPEQALRFLDGED